MDIFEKTELPSSNNTYYTCYMSDSDDDNPITTALPETPPSAHAPDESDTNLLKFRKALGRIKYLKKELQKEKIKGDELQKKMELQADLTKKFEKHFLEKEKELIKLKEKNRKLIVSNHVAWNMKEDLMKRMDLVVEEKSAVATATATNEPPSKKRKLNTDSENLFYETNSKTIEMVLNNENEYKNCSFRRAITKKYQRGKDRPTIKANRTRRAGFRGKNFTNSNLQNQQNNSLTGIEVTLNTHNSQNHHIDTNFTTHQQNDPNTNRIMAPVCFSNPSPLPSNWPISQFSNQWPSNSMIANVPCVTNPFNWNPPIYQPINNQQIFQQSGKNYAQQNNKNYSDWKK